MYKYSKKRGILYRCATKVVLAFFVMCFTHVRLDAATCTYECNAGYYVLQGVCKECNEEFIANYLVGVLGAHSDVYSAAKKYYCEHHKVSVSKDADKPCSNDIKKKAYGHNIRECAGGMVANTTHSGCVEAEDTSKNYSGCVDPAPEEMVAGGTGVICKAGYFLPDGSRKCCPCNDKNLEKIKTILEKNFASTGFDVSKAYCPDNCLAFFDENTTSCVQFCEEPKSINNNHTACVTKTTVTSTTTSSSTTTETKTLVCPAGQVWVNGQCVLCTSKAVWISYANENRMYCPGVTDTSLPILQQLKNCPKGAWPNSDLTDCDCRWGTKAKNGDSCQGTLYHDDLYYGPDGKNTKLFKQCWTKVSEKAYKKCMGFDN